MLRRLQVQGFKSLHDVDVELAPLVVVFGPNAAGKSNLLESLVLLSRLIRERTLADAFDEGIRGYPAEAFTLLDEEGAPATRQLSLTAEVTSGDGVAREYAVTVSIETQSGELHLIDERLARMSRRKATAAIETIVDKIRLRRKDGRASHPYEEKVGIGHTIVSNLQYSGADRYPDLEALRAEVGAWRIVYLDPREAMRRSQPPREVDDIGERGEYLVPFLHRLRVTETGKPAFGQVLRAARQVIPSIDDIKTELVVARGEIDLTVRQEGRWMPARVLSEGTLRVLALCSMAANPFQTGLVAFEEPENGVHPRRVQVVAQLLASASTRRQVVVTTHSPLVVGEIVQLIRSGRLTADNVRLLQCSGGPDGTRVRTFAPSGPLFEDKELGDALVASDDAALVQAGLVRGWLDG